MNNHLTPPKIAKMYGCNVYKILTWIRNGELKAINIATKLGGRPRYIVKREELEAFERRRQVQPPPPIVRRRRRKDPNVIEYF